MARLSPEEAAAKWASRTSAASGDYAAGIERVTEAPGAKAARKAAKWRQGIQDNAAKWERNVAAVPLDVWKSAARDKGAARLAQGVQAAESKMADFQREIQPHIDSGLSKINAMPDTTVEERIAKSAAWQRHMATFSRRR